MEHDDYIDFFKPHIGEEEINEVTECLKSGWLTTASRTKQFEKEFSEYIGQKYALALNSCTAALHLALEALGLKKNQIVLVPTMTFAATAEVVRYFDAIPILVDCNEDDLCMNMAEAERIIKDILADRKVPGLPEKHGKIAGIIPVHYGGQIADILKCREICNEYRLFLVEDAAHCCPAYYKNQNNKWTMVGKTADITCFSFYANKTITTGEGGMAVTDNKKLAERMRIMSLHGISKDAWKRFTKEGSWYYEIIEPGFKYNCTDIASSLGIHQLRKADKFFELRRKTASVYSEKLADLPGVDVPVEHKNRKHAWHLYVIKIDKKICGISRNEFIDKLKKCGVGTGVHYIPLHHHPYYQKQYSYENQHFPTASSVFQKIISLPIFPGMNDLQIEKVWKTVKSIAED